MFDFIIGFSLATQFWYPAWNLCCPINYVGLYWFSIQWNVYKICPVWANNTKGCNGKMFYSLFSFIFNIYTLSYVHCFQRCACVSYGWLPNFVTCVKFCSHLWSTFVTRWRVSVSMVLLQILSKKKISKKLFSL